MSVSSTDPSGQPPTLPGARVLVVQHGADDPPGRVGSWLTEAGCTLEVVRGDLGEELPATLAPYAALVVLGGAMGAYDDDACPWLAPTKRLLREAAERDVPTLGICLGHQLLAVANDGRVATAAEPQVGLRPVGLTAEAAGDRLLAGLAAGTGAVHWNNDVVVEPPTGAVVLATGSEGIQVFRLGRSVYGVQFHPEVEVETVAAWAQQDVTAGRWPAEVAAARIAAIAAADGALRAAWQPVIHQLAGLVRAPVS